MTSSLRSVQIPGHTRTYDTQEVAVARSITKAELLDAVSSEAGVSKSQAEGVLSAFFDTATSAAKAGNKIAWPGFGSFQGNRRAARQGRNPQTGATIPVAAATVMKFTSSSTLKASLNPRKAAGKKAATKKSATKKSGAKKATAKKKAPAKRGPARKAPAKRAPARKAPAKKATKKR
ncbi:hypothetical protein BH20ACT2_BH20ACT2_23570 [soil metagenome]